jgi:catalase
MLQGRLFSYPDTHRHRLGSNYELLPVNRPRATEARNYARDGFMRLDANGGDGPNYEPNSFNGPKEAPQYQEPGEVLVGTSGHYKTTRHAEDNDFVQAGNLYRLMDAGAKARLVHNIVVHLKNARREIQSRQVSNFAQADPEFGRRLSEGLGLTGAAPAGTPAMATRK